MDALIHFTEWRIIRYTTLISNDLCADGLLGSCLETKPNKGRGINEIKKEMAESSKAFLQGLQTVLKKRDLNTRRYLMLTMLSFLGVLFASNNFNQYFMYLRLKLNFKMEDFSYWSGYSGIFIVIGNFIFVPFVTKRLKFHDATIALIGTITRFISFLNNILWNHIRNA